LISVNELETRYHYLPASLLEILVELRNLVKEIVPDACEDVRPQGLVYYHADRGGPVSAGICQILIEPHHIRLAFNHGRFLPDSTGLLKSDGKRLIKRYTRITSFDSAPWEELKELISASSRFDPYTETFRSK
jgi:hypothetical protein